jgi:hypothetical protein
VNPTRIDNLSRRERQIMQTIHRLGGGTVAEVLEQMPENLPGEWRAFSGRGIAK